MLQASTLSRTQENMFYWYAHIGTPTLVGPYKDQGELISALMRDDFNGRFGLLKMNAHTKGMFSEGIWALWGGILVEVHDE